MRVLPRVLLVSLLGIAMVGLPLLPDGPLRPLQVDDQRVDLAFADDGGGAWIASPIEGEATVAGLTWDDVADAPEKAEVRVRVDGEWGDWEAVPTDDEHAPDPGSEEDIDTRGGTAPIIIEGAEAVQFRVTDDSPPEDLAADIVDVDDPDGAKRVQEQPGAAEAAPGRPNIRSRSSWGGNSCPGGGTGYVTYADQVEVLFVHHTASTNSYSQSQVPGIIRGICSFHVNGRGWDDIGYNALVDKFGGIWEGRAGGIERAVQGAHTGGFNSASTGVSLIGNHQTGGPSGSALAALERYIAWKLDVHNVDPDGRTRVTSQGSSRYSSGTNVTLDNVSGHRDASLTSCPGQYCYSRLGGIAADARARGGFKIFGGWAQDHAMTRRGNGSWEQPTFTFDFTHRAQWVFELRAPDGTRLLRRTGTNSGPVDITWNARRNGGPAPFGEYSVRVTATRTANGAAATPADHTVQLGFEDVDGSNVFHDDIAWLELQGITKGCNPPSNSRFCPGSRVTRGQMAAFLNRALNLPAGSGTFRDTRGTVFEADIAALARAGITKGCNPPANTRFCPDDSVTREQMAAFLVRAQNLSRINHPGFRDVSSSNVFRADIRRLATAGITKGCNPPSNTRYCPNDPVTREQMAAFLNRAL